MYPVDNLSTFWTTWAWFKSVCEPAPKSFFLALALSTRYDWTVKKAIAHLLIRLKGNSKRISLYSLSPLDAQDMDLRLLRRRSCPFCKRSLPFLRQKFGLLLKAFLLKGKKIAIQGRTWTSNPDLPYPNLSPLPLHYHSRPAKIPKWN